MAVIFSEKTEVSFIQNDKFGQEYLFMRKANGQLMKRCAFIDEVFLLELFNKQINLIS